MLFKKGDIQSIMKSQDEIKAERKIKMLANIMLEVFKKEFNDYMVKFEEDPNKSKLENISNLCISYLSDGISSSRQVRDFAEACSKANLSVIIMESNFTEDYIIDTTEGKCKNIYCIDKFVMQNTFSKEDGEYGDPLYDSELWYSIKKRADKSDLLICIVNDQLEDFFI